MASDGNSGTNGAGTAGSVLDKAAVLAQLDRILGSPAFRNSKRYPSLLRHLVEKTLEGETGDLKERNLGVGVFGRSADYDNNTDPVVRVSASEIRKRIAQYYHEPGREKEIRIELPLGSYVPDFHYPPAGVEPAPPLDAAASSAKSHALRGLRVALVCALCALAVLLVWRPWSRPTALELFWRPFLDRNAPVIVCVARAPVVGAPLAEDRPPVYAWADFYSSARAVGLMEGLGQPYLLRREGDVTFEDLRHSPAVLVGAFNDVWTIRLTENLRFQFQSTDSVRWIHDRDNPSSRAWSVPSPVAGAPLTNSGRDFAVVSRLLTPRSGKPVMAVAGLHGNGTEVAGEFATNRAFLEALAQKAPPGWERRNLQVVLETEVIDGHSGPPLLLAVHSW